ncbi:transcription initiation factor IIB [Coemansia sp. RSA 1813]|nr:transcription initiation factor IIB [Coemansia sp. RSA 1646]KAJ1770750.1 transcription initiation factor IIB [Coemansia sp. RSA 1843]KAJ2088764.1 transcription initiation factor IIB [Coemansia sp. RSA 986]KAJ2213700.1 transcription initiation factor IIB [Coemansia sp. RSA 487]KAJ2568697.1 transcription initiation factor IIB [Coemansia sp. RSA 1813]
MTKPAEMDQPSILSGPESQFCVKLICPDCRNPIPNIVEDFTSGDYVCGDCGLVLGDRIIDTRSEWRTFANEDGDDPSRVGNAANPFLDGAQLDTVIARGGDSGSGMARNLNRTQGRTTAQRNERNLVQAYKEISALCDAYDMPRSIVDIAKQLYKKVEDDNLLRGKSNDAIIAACIFLACRQEGAPRTFKEICALTKVDRKDIGRTFKFLKSKLGTNAGTTSSDDLIARFCSNLNLGPETRIITRQLTQKAKDMENISGKNPVSIASACIYMASHLVGDGREAKAISEIAGIGEATIKATYKILYANRYDILTPEILARSPKASEKNLITP